MVKDPTVIEQAVAAIKLKVDVEYLLGRLNYINALIYVKEKYKPSSKPLMNLTFLGAIQVLIDQPTLIEYEDASKEDIVVIGDLHGDVIGLIKKWQYATIRMEESSKTKVIFLGDYVDRGPESLACVEFVCILQQLYPERVILLRGNHEIRKVNGRNEKNSFKQNCSAKYIKKKDGEEVYEGGSDVFDYMSLMCIIGKGNNKILFLHGFIDPEVDLKEVREIAKPIQGFDERPDWVAVRLMWNDPQTHINASVDEEEPFSEENGPRHVGYLVNKPAAIKWMDDNGIAIIYRGHQLVPVGVEECFDHRVVTVFSADHYEGRNNITAMVRLYRDGTRSVIYFREAESAGDRIRVEEIPTEYDLDAPKKKEEADKKDKDGGKGAKGDLKRGKNEDKKNERKGGEKGAGPAGQKVKGKDVAKTTKNAKQDGNTSMGSSSGTGVVRLASIGTAFAMLLVFSLFGNITAAPASPSNSLSQFATNSSILARFVNGISLGRSISEGTLDKKQLAEELFYLGPDVTMDSLAASKVSQTADDLASIQKVLDVECSGDDGCGIPSSIMAIMKTVDSYQQHFKIISDAKKASETSGTKLLAQLLTHLTEINRKIRENLVAQLEKDLRIIKVNVTEDSLKNVKEASKKFGELNALLKTVPPMLEEIETKLLVDLKSKLQSILPMKTIAKSLFDQKASTETLKKWLVSAGRSYGEIGSFVNAVKFQSIVEQIDFLNNVAPHTKGVTKLTAGFINGFNDFKSAVTIDQNNWLKEFINSGEGLNATTLLLKSIEPLSKQIENLSPSFEKLKSSGGKHLLDLKRFLTENPTVLPKMQTLISDYLIYFGLDFQSPYEADVQAAIDWTDQKSPEVPNNLKGSIEKLVTDQKKSLDAVSEFVNTAGSKMGEAPDASLVDKILQSLNDFTTELSSLKNVGFKKLGEWLKSGKMTEVTTSTKDWIDDSGFLKTLGDLQKHVDMKKIEELAPLAKNIALLKTGNEDVESTVEMINSISSLIGEWNKLKPTLASKSKRGAESNLKNAQKVSKDLGDISSITLKLDGMLKSEGHVNALIGGKQVVDSAIGEVKDQEEQDRLKKMWTPENLAALQKNLATAKAVSDVVSKNKIVGNMTDFKAPFEKASEVQGCSIDIRRLASSLKGMIQDQTVAASLESSKTLDLQFVKYDVKRVGGVITDLQSYFDSVFGIKKSKTCDPAKSSCPDTTTPESPGWDWWVYLLIALGCLSLIASAVGGFSFFCCKKKKPEVTPPDDGKIIKPAVTVRKATPATEKPKKTPADPTPMTHKIHPVHSDRINGTKNMKKKEISDKEKKERAEERKKDNEEAVKEMRRARVKVRKNSNNHFIIEPPKRPFNGKYLNSKLGMYAEEFSTPFMDETITDLKEAGLNQVQITRYFRKRRSFCEANARFMRFVLEAVIRLLYPYSAVYNKGPSEYNDESHPVVENPDRSILTSLPINSIMLLVGAVEEYYQLLVEKINPMTTSTKTCANSSKDIRTEDTQASEKENTRTATDNSTRTATGSDSTATAIGSDSTATATKIDWSALSLADFEASIGVYVQRFFPETSEPGTASENQSRASSSSTSVIELAEVFQQGDETGKNDRSNESVSSTSVASIASVSDSKFVSPEQRREQALRAMIQKFREGEQEVKKLKYPYGLYYFVIAKDWVREKFGMETFNDYHGYLKQEMNKIHKV